MLRDNGDSSTGTFNGQTKDSQSHISTFSDLHAARDHMVCLFINQRVLIIH